MTDLDLGHVPVSRARLLPIYSRIANKVQPYSCAFWPVGAVVKSIHTAAAARGPCRHNSSYMNIAFLEIANRMYIIIGIMPLHSTHRIQPLDISMFRPLLITYTN